MRFFIILFIILASYGSLYPFEFELNAHSGTSFFAPLWDNATNTPSISDILGNIALFLPLGVIITLQNKRNHSTNHLLFLSGVALATTLQVLQLYTPSRDPNLLDVIWNIVGIITGILVGGIFRPRNHNRSTPITFNIELLLIGSWVVFQLIPFVPTLDIGLIWGNVKQLLPPFQFSFTVFLAHFSSWLVVGFFLKKALPDKKCYLFSLIILVTFTVKFFLVDATISFSSYLAGLIAIIVWQLRLAKSSYKAETLIILLLSSIIAKGLFPFEFNNYVKPFNWIPFYGFLTGSMLINVQNLLEKLFLYGSLLWLIPQQMRHAFTFILIALTTSIEIFQIFLVDHTPEITDPLLVILFALSAKYLPSTQSDYFFTTTRKIIPKFQKLPELPTTIYQKYSQSYALLLIPIILMTLTLKLFLSLPQLPYNIKELFLNDGSLLSLFCFSLFLVWFSISGPLLSNLSLKSIINSILLFPISIAFSALAYALIKFSVSYESLSDILGSLSIRRAIENEGLWGNLGQTLLIFPNVIDKLERYVRFIALISPLMLAMCFWTTLFSTKNLSVKPQLILIQGLVLLVSFLMAKFISIDNAATDNLTELIAENGLPFLGALILLLTLNAAYLAKKPINLQITRISSYLFSIIAIILGWYLFNLGLAENINKYGYFFSGVDFLLGPDRKSLLSSSSLFIRWSLLYFSLVLLLNFGSRLVISKPLLPVKIKSRTHNTPLNNHKRTSNKAVKFKFKQRDVIYTGISIATILILVAIISNQDDSSHLATNKEKPILPAADQLPTANIFGFRVQHPRLPAPTTIEIEQLIRNNPNFIHSIRNFAKNGNGHLYQTILDSLIQPNINELNTLYQRLIDLQFEGRGNVQATPLAQAYDWLYPYWSAQQKLGLQHKLIEGCHYLTDFIREERLSPYNVYLYNSPFQALMATAIAIYKDDPQGQTCMNFTYDLWKNRVLPVWRQIMGKNGGWHEGGEYVGIGIGQAIYQVPAMWRKATGEDLFKTEPGIEGFLDFLIYRTRPDGTHMRWGDSSFFDRMIPDKTALAIEFKNKAAYSLGGCPRPNKPSARLWGPLTTNTLCDPKSIYKLPLTRYFDGIGVVIARSSWNNDATYVTFKAGNNYWSHSHLDQGAFTIYKGGSLAIDSGIYGPKYGSDHHMNYSYQTIAHNVITVTDNNDTIPVPDKKDKNKYRIIANDGGQRRIGSGWGVEAAPIDLHEWLNKQDIYRTGEVEKYYSDDNFVIAIANLTPAYTNKKSGTGTFSARTRRVESYWRTFIYDRSIDVILIFDNIESTTPNYTKRSLLHTINRPILQGNKITTRVYNGEKNSQQAATLEATILFPKQAYINIIGGRGKEFLIQGENYDENGKLLDFIKKRKKNLPEPGSWRVEVIPPLAQKNDRFLTVYNPKLSYELKNIHIEALETQSEIGCRIKGKSQTHSFLFSKRKHQLTIKFDNMNLKNIELTIPSP